MQKIITYENLRSFACSNDKLIKGEIKGVVLMFFGLGGSIMYSDDNIEQTNFKVLAEKGILIVVPYYNPWSWMNRQAIEYTDEILDVLFKKYSLPENTPIVSTGGSMGGLSSLVYCVYAKRTPVACVSNCPVCNLLFHFTEREDLPRTIYSALFNESGTLDEAIKRYSPLHLITKMPKIEYYIFHCDMDTAVRKDLHSDKFVQKMKESGFNITYHVINGRGHCDLPEDMLKLFENYSINAILKSI